MPLFERLSHHGYSVARKVAGERSVEVIHAIDEWTLPPGYSYSKRNDAILDASNAPVSRDEYSHYWKSTSIPVLFISAQSSNPLAAGGELDAGNTLFLVDDVSLKALLDNAFGFLVNGEVYRIISVSPTPTDAPTSLTVTGQKYGRL